MLMDKCELISTFIILLSTFISTTTLCVMMSFGSKNNNNKKNSVLGSLDASSSQLLSLLSQVKTLPIILIRPQFFPQNPSLKSALM